MKKSDKYEKISFHCPADIAERLERMSKVADVPKSKLVLNLVNASLETMEECEKVGILQFSLLIRDMRDKMKEWSKNIKGKNKISSIVQEKA